MSIPPRNCAIRWRSVRISWMRRSWIPRWRTGSRSPAGCMNWRGCCGDSSGAATRRRNLSRRSCGSAGHSRRVRRQGSWSAWKRAAGWRRSTGTSTAPRCWPAAATCGRPRPPTRSFWRNSPIWSAGPAPRSGRKRACTMRTASSSSGRRTASARPGSCRRRRSMPSGMSPLYICI